MEVILFIIVAILCYLVSAMIHEMGHVAYGLLHHWKLYMLVVGPMKLYRETLDSKLKIGIEKNPILWGGVGGTLPQEENGGECECITSESLVGCGRTVCQYGAHP